MVSNGWLHICGAQGGAWAGCGVATPTAFGAASASQASFQRLCQPDVLREPQSSLLSSFERLRQPDVSPACLPSFQASFQLLSQSQVSAERLSSLRRLFQQLCRPEVSQARLLSFQPSFEGLCQPEVSPALCGVYQSLCQLIAFPTCPDSDKSGQLATEVVGAAAALSTRANYKDKVLGACTRALIIRLRRRRASCTCSIDFSARRWILSIQIHQTLRH